MQEIWGGEGNAIARYAAIVSTARAAAALPTVTAVADDPWQLIGSMLAGGYDRNAANWAARVDAGSHAWGVLAVGLPQPLGGTSTGDRKSTRLNSRPKCASRMPSSA